MGGTAEFIGQFIPGFAGGGMPFGNSGHGSVLGQLEAARYQASHNSALTNAARQDRGDVQRFAYRMAQMTGTADQFTDQTAEDVGKLYDQMVQFAPQMDNPAAFRAIDFVTGGRSAVPMAHYLHQAGRSMRDPLTGMRGLSGNSAADIAVKLKNDLFEKPGDFSQTAGLRSAEVGEMMSAMSERGYLTTTDPRIGNLTREGAANQIKDQIKSYSRVLGVMKEIFAEGGRPDAPMNELLSAAEAMTGGLQSMSTREAEAKLRTFKAAADSRGMTMDGMAVALQAAGGIRNEFGLNAAFDLTLGEHGLNASRSLTMSGVMNSGAWGMRPIEEMEDRAVRQRAGFIASEQGNRLAALNRMASDFYGDGNGKIDVKKIQGDSRAARAMRALAAGDFENADLASLLKDEGAFTTEVAKALGMNEQDVASEIAMKDQNQEDMSRNRLDRAQGAIQGANFREEFFGRGYSNVTRDALGRRGINNADLAERLRKASADAVQGLSAQDAVNRSKREGAQTKALRSALEAAAKSDNPAEAAAAREYLRQIQGREDIEMRRLGRQQTELTEEQMREDGSLVTSFEAEYGLLSRGSVRREQEEAAHNRVRAVVTSATAGTISANMWDRLSDSIHNSEGKTITEAVKGALGYDVTGKQAEQVARAFKRMESLGKELADQEADESGAGVDPKRTQMLRQQLEEESKKLATFINDPQNAALKDKVTGGKSGEDASAGSGDMTLEGVSLIVNFKDGQIRGSNGSGRGSSQRRGGN
jgi:hypothetical protein